MASRKWRTVSCTDDGLRSHGSAGKAYDWIASRPAGERFRVQYDEQLGDGWRLYATVMSTADGIWED